MELPRNTPEPGPSVRSSKPPSVSLIILKSIVIAVAVVTAVSLATRAAFALIGPLS